MPGFCARRPRLRRYPVTERGGFLFLTFEKSPLEIDTWLANFAEIHAAWPLASLRTARRRKFKVSCNWKAFLDVFNEYYRLPYVHADTLADIYAPPDPGDHTEGAFASQFGRIQGSAGTLQDSHTTLPLMPGLDAQAAEGTRYTWLFPNLTFALSHDLMWVYEAYPLSTDECEVVQTICFPAETLADHEFEALSAAVYERMDLALEEDAVALANQHRVMRNLHAAHGPVQPLLESNVCAFARWYTARFEQA